VYQHTFSEPFAYAKFSRRLSILWLLQLSKHITWFQALIKHNRFCATNYQNKKVTGRQRKDAEDSLLATLHGRLII